MPLFINKRIVKNWDAIEKFKINVAWNIDFISL